MVSCGFMFVRKYFSYENLVSYWFRVNAFYWFRECLLNFTKSVLQNVFHKLGCLFAVLQVSVSLTQNASRALTSFQVLNRR